MCNVLAVMAVGPMIITFLILAFITIWIGWGAIKDFKDG